MNRGFGYTLLGMDTEAQLDVDRAVELGLDGTDLEAAIVRLKTQR